MRGIIVDSRLERGRGPIVDIQITEGVLLHGEVLRAGQAIGRANILAVKSLEHGALVEVKGLNECPSIGDIVESEEEPPRYYHHWLP
jgi:translation initiation factor IF-2